MNALSLTNQHRQRRQQSLVVVETTTRSSACGHANLPKATFCGKCGASLSTQSLSFTTYDQANPAGLKFCRSCGSGQSAAPVRTPALLSSSLAPLPPSHHLSPESERSPSSPSQHAALNTQYSVVVGREAELTQLQNVFEKALRGERQIVFVSGEAGIGKTTLVDAFLAQIRNRADVLITSGQCVEQYGPGEAYMPLLEATQRLCRAPGGEQHIEALQRYAPSWMAQLPSLLEPQEFARLQQRVQGTNRERMLREMAEAAELFTAQQGAVVVLEDLHWSDVSTLEWLSYMARQREPAKLLILGTYRPTETAINNHLLRGIVQELQARRHCDEVRLEPLAEEAIAEYLVERFALETRHASPLQELAPLLYRRTGGNPLFVVNVVDDLLQQGIVREEAGRWQVHGDQSSITESVPDTLRQVIARQVERLSEAEQRLLEVASIVGVEFSAAAVAAGLQVTVEEVDQQCELLARQGQFIHSQGIEEWPDNTLSERYSFQHALYQAVLAERMTETQKVRVHRRVGERKALAYGERAGEIATELAVHFEKGRELRRAISYLDRAGRNALQRSANAEASRHLTHALTLLAGLPASVERTRQELTLHLALGTPLLALKGYGAPEVRHHYQQARALCRELDDPPDLFPVLWGLWLSHAVAGDLSAAEELGSQLFQFAGHMGDADLSFQAHHALWTTLVARGDLTTCQLHIEQGLQLYQTDRHYAQTFVYGGHDPGACCRIHGGFLYWLRGYPDRALQLSQEALVLGKELSHGQTLAWALSGNAMVHQFRGEPMAAQKAAEEAIALSTEQQFALWAAYSPAVLGWALVAQGKKEQGLAQTQAGLAALRATGTGIWQSQFLALLASAYGETGQIQEGLRTIDEALVASARNGERFYEAELYRLKGELLLNNERKMQNDERKTKEEKQETVPIHHSSFIIHRSEEAEECFQKAIAIAREQEAKSWELRAATSLARLWQSQGKLREARTLLEDIYGWFTEGFDTKDLQEAEALLRALGSTEERQKAKGKKQKTKIENLSLPSNTQHLAPDPRPLIPDLVSSNSQPPAPNSFRPEGEYWTVSFAGTTCRLKEARGLHYIAHLLQHPHQEVHVITLITVSADLNEGLAEAHLFQDPSLSVDHTEGFSDAGEVLDPQARSAYKQRVSELRAELDEAREFHDLGRGEKLQAELDFLTHELTSAVGLGGRARRAGSPAERARVNITRAIKIALRKITAHHPALGQHLATTIKTGAYCSYTPDVRMPTTWQG